MHPFSYHRAVSAEDAVARLAAPGALPLGGGTDLLVFLKEDLARPESLVDLRAIPALREVARSGDGVRIGGAVRIAQLAEHDVVAAGYPLLAQACASVGTPALRRMGTIAGNLCQRPRCWYYRRNIRCLKHGGTECHAYEGENQYHAILGGGPCYIVHPSDPAVALTALDASIVVSSPGGERLLPIDRFYRSPAERLDHETALEAGELVSAIDLPAAAAGGVQRYYKLMQRGSWDFALVSLAAARRADGDVRLVLGGVAPHPWRLDRSIEEDVASGRLDADDVGTLADRALYDARPLAHNAYKVTLATTLIRRAIADLVASDGEGA